MIKKMILHLIWIANLSVFFLWVFLGVYRRIICNFFVFFEDVLAPEELAGDCDFGAILVILIHAIGSFLTFVISVLCYIMDCSHKRICFIIMIISLIATLIKYFLPAFPYTI